MKKILTFLFLFNLIILTACKSDDAPGFPNLENEGYFIYQEFLARSTFSDLDIFVKHPDFDFRYAVSIKGENITVTTYFEGTSTQIKYTKSTSSYQTKIFNVYGEVIEEGEVLSIDENTFKEHYVFMDQFKLNIDFTLYNKHFVTFQSEGVNRPKGRIDSFDLANYPKQTFQVFDRSYEMSLTNLYIGSYQQKKIYKLYSYTIRGTYQNTNEIMDIKINVS
ncbi:MAG TPA: hypothetical protein VK005_01060 [Acholeplasma sp.]|nr:hypothetical protein [Acholeplasma sp.]